jgi:hypothetical protein
VHLRVGTPQGSTVNVHAWELITGPVIRAAIGMRCLRLLHSSGGHASIRADSLLRQAMINWPNNALHTDAPCPHAFCMRKSRAGLRRAGERER